jgi:hypothetical protein
VTSRLLLGLTEDVNVPARRVCHGVSIYIAFAVWRPTRKALTSNIRSVITSAVITQSRDLSHLLGSELNLLEVVLNTRGSNRLRDDTVTSNLGPGKAENMVLATEITITH